MKVAIHKYGDLLASRPAGREAILAMPAHLPPLPEGETLELDFDGVLVVAPSWLDELLFGLREMYGDRVRCLPSGNASLKASLETLDQAAQSS